MTAFAMSGVCLGDATQPVLGPTFGAATTTQKCGNNAVIEPVQAGMACKVKVCGKTCMILFWHYENFGQKSIVHLSGAPLPRQSYP